MKIYYHIIYNFNKHFRIIIPILAFTALMWFLCFELFLDAKILRTQKNYEATQNINPPIL